jgi:hypothetical protein
MSYRQPTDLFAISTVKREIMVAQTESDGMTTVQEYRCEICGRVTSNPMHWFVIQCSDSNLTVARWSSEAANAEAARHFCGEAHAQVYISRWFESICSPPKPDFTKSVSAKS